MAKAVGKVNKAGKTSEHVPHPAHATRDPPSPVNERGEEQACFIHLSRLREGMLSRAKQGRARVTVAEGRMEGKFPS
jgi:hypothetical protein